MSACQQDPMSPGTRHLHVCTVTPGHLRTQGHFLGFAHEVTECAVLQPDG